MLFQIVVRQGTFLHLHLSELAFLRLNLQLQLLDLAPGLVVLPREEGRQRRMVLPRLLEEANLVRQRPHLRLHLIECNVFVIRLFETLLQLLFEIVNPICVPLDLKFSFFELVVGKAALLLHITVNVALVEHVNTRLLIGLVLTH